VEELRQLGASVVVPEEFETSIEIFARVLELYGVTSSEIRRRASELRRDMYRFLRQAGTSPSRSQASLARLAAHMEFDDILVNAESTGAGQTIGALNVRERTGAHVVAVLRDGQAHYAPDETFVIQPGDRVVIIGDSAALAKGVELFRGATASP
jgi:monovalent cation:H+ antiporter-2, CPA2 family